MCDMVAMKFSSFVKYSNLQYLFIGQANNSQSDIDTLDNNLRKRHFLKEWVSLTICILVLSFFWLIMRSSPVVVHITHIRRVTDITCLMINEDYESDICLRSPHINVLINVMQQSTTKQCDSFPGNDSSMYREITFPSKVSYYPFDVSVLHWDFLFMYLHIFLCSKNSSLVHDIWNWTFPLIDVNVWYLITTL